MPMVMPFGIVVVMVVVMMVLGKMGPVMAAGPIMVTGMVLVALVVSVTSALMAFSAVTSAAGPCAGGKKHCDDDCAYCYFKLRWFHD